MTPNHKPAPGKSAVTRVIQFALVGASNTAIDLACFNLFLIVGQWPVLPSSIGANAVAIAHSYFWNSRWTFGDRASRDATNLPRFLVVTVAGMAIHGICVWLLQGLYASYFVHSDAAPGVIAANLIKIVAIAVSMVWNYALYRRWAFRD